MRAEVWGAACHFGFGLPPHFLALDGCWEVAWDPDFQYDEDGLLVFYNYHIYQRKRGLVTS